MLQSVDRKLASGLVEPVVLVGTLVLQTLEQAGTLELVVPLELVRRLLEVAQRLEQLQLLLPLQLQLVQLQQELAEPLVVA